MNTGTAIVLVLIGMIAGFPVGRWYAESSRGRFDASKAWQSRGNYRRKGK